MINTSIANIRQITVEATITRADGSIENLGVIASKKFGLLDRLIMKFKGVK